jgi:hypothetical protein
VTQPRRATPPPNAQPLLDVPRSADGRPIGTRCGPDCRAPVGGSQAHCGTCHQTTRTTGDWQRHRQDGWCLNLASLGLVEQGGIWATPEGHVAADRAREMLAARRGGDVG